MLRGLSFQAAEQIPAAVFPWCLYFPWLKFVGLTVGGIFKPILNTLLEIFKTALYRELTFNRRKIINAWPCAKYFEVTVSGTVTDQLTETQCLRPIGDGIFINIAKIDHPHGAILRAIRQFAYANKVGTKI